VRRINTDEHPVRSCREAKSRPFALPACSKPKEDEDLTLISMTPDLIYDQMIGISCARKLNFSWEGNPDVGSLHCFRDAVEKGSPQPLELEEHSHAGMANRYVSDACSAAERPHFPRGADPPGHGAAHGRAAYWEPRKCLPVVAALLKGAVGTFLEIGCEEPSGLLLQLRKRSRALLLGDQGCSMLGFANVALRRSKSHVESTSRLAPGHAAFYSGDYGTRVCGANHPGSADSLRLPE